ncbi:putative ribonuclease H protein [Cardamine amara subsp. amara]|uniref:Ribonuclease H protein n=1 Tax=Cardamine amara subsp. amara TaxID=228776 RepID=A0ABD0ZV93_CARAN
MLLTSEVTEEEIYKVLFSMPNNKSPGPDGYNSEFFKEVWPIIGKEFIIGVQSFFAKGFLPKGINSTILALVPKKQSSTEMKDYRPISCCNVLYKVISKILANRLKGVLPYIISMNQSAFVKDRLLIENLLLATELVKDYHKESISSRCAIKIDISKAFDSVQWSFLLNTLKALNFPDIFIHWISLCITTASFSVQVNGELVGYFQSNRGLRQGCPLSPYLFVLAMNVLSKLLDKAASARQTGFHPKCKNLGLTHLSFADDILVFTDWKIRSIEGIVEVFDEFARYSGLQISLEKSTLYLAGVTAPTRDGINTRFPFSIGQLPVRYLGLPLLTRKMTATAYQPLIDSIKGKINTWTTRFLSLAGRLQLISSVLMSISNFWLSAFQLPKACLKEIEKLCSSFLWSGPALNPKKAKVAWEDLCKPKDEGGLGLRPLSEVSKVFRLKLVWRIISASSSLWVKWIQMNLLHKGSFWSIGESSNRGSWMWRKILKARPLARDFHKVRIGDGKQTSFWYDCWSELGCIYDVLGPRGVVDLGIPLSSTVASAWTATRRRRHRTENLCDIERILELKRTRSVGEPDTPLWRHSGDNYKNFFNSKATWKLIRNAGPPLSWTKCIWFKHSTPKFSLFAWLAIKNRLATGERMSYWNVGANTSCIFCRDPMESRQHLFFSCTYSHEVWAYATKGLLKSRFSSHWHDILPFISGNALDRRTRFLYRYVFQATVHILWRERNARRHGEAPNPPSVIQKMIDKQVRNRCATLGDNHFDGSLQLWFSARGS